MPAYDPDCYLCPGNARIFARNPKEAASLGEVYRMISEGFVQAIIELLKDLCLWEIEHDTHRFPFIFFEEAHLYVSASAKAAMLRSTWMARKTAKGALSAQD